MRFGDKMSSSAIPPIRLLVEELEALLAIYSDCESAVSHRSQDDTTILQLSFPSPRLTLRLFVPKDYPDTEPGVEVDDLDRDARTRCMRSVGQTVDRLAGGPMLFDVVEAIRAAVEGPGEAAASTGAGSAKAEEADEEEARIAAEVAAAAASKKTSKKKSKAAATEAEAEVEIITGEPLVVNKSTFLPHVARVTSRAQVDAVVSALLSDNRIARATHPVIRAYRFTDPATGRTHADNDDDGEDAAGGRLAHLLELLNAENVVIVVTRWFGGVLLGPSRFKYINECARQLLEREGFSNRGGFGER